MNIILKNKRPITLAGILLFAVVYFSFFALTPKLAHGNPSDFCLDYTNPNNVATSSLAYLSPGAGTTTITATNCAGGISAVESAIVLLQYTASSTAPTLNARVEYSQDKIDWYGTTVALNELATSTRLTGDAATYQFVMATSTDNAGSGTSGRLHRSFEIKTPTKYTRVIFYVPASGGNGALSAQIVGKKQF